MSRQHCNVDQEMERESLKTKGQKGAQTSSETHGSSSGLDEEITGKIGTSGGWLTGALVSASLKTLAGSYFTM